MTHGFQLNQRLVPVVVLERAEDAIPLAEALISAGLQQIEITLRSPVALDGIRQVRERFPEMLVGAGTILDPAVIRQLVDLGVSFGVSPGMDERVLDAAEAAGLPMAPGVMTPSEIDRARSRGLKLLKFFPAETAGGSAMVKALAGPYGHTGVRFIPTGGIDAAKAREYFAMPEVAAVGGSWFVNKKLIADGAFGEIERLTCEALEVAAEYAK